MKDKKQKQITERRTDNRVVALSYGMLSLVLIILLKWLRGVGRWAILRCSVGWYCCPEF